MQAKIVYVFAVNLMFRAFYALFDVPHNALLARLIAKSYERTTLSGQRLFFSTLGALTIATAISPIMVNGNTALQAQLFVLFAAITAVISLWFLRFTIRAHDSSQFLNSQKNQHSGLPITTFLHNI